MLGNSLETGEMRILKKGSVGVKCIFIRNKRLKGKVVPELN
jgi:hypothetical protein